MSLPIAIWKSASRLVRIETWRLPPTPATTLASRSMLAWPASSIRASKFLLALLLPPTVGKSELAWRFGVSLPRVSQFVALGMPVRDDGRIELEQACQWMLDTIIDQWTDDASPAVRAAERILSGN